jgi:hypothetical protein
MKRDAIKMTVEAALGELGFDAGLWSWGKGRLEILIGESVRTIPLKSGMSRLRLNYELGRLAGWADWTRRNKPTRPLREHPVYSEPHQIDLEELLR